VKTAALRPLVGRYGDEIARDRGVSDFDAMIDIAIEGDLDVGFVRSQYAPDDDWSWQARLEVLKDERVIPEASDAGAHLDMMCGADFPTRCFAELVRDREAFTPEEFVHRFADAPARLYGLKGRGRLVPGGWADVAVLDPDTLGSTGLETIQDFPGGTSRLTAGSSGVSHVFVAGTAVVVDGTLTGERPGRLLRSGRDTETVRARPGTDVRPALAAP
jgi:N-acyl-D-aspartate/D-glutamate deacylase